MIAAASPATKANNTGALKMSKESFSPYPVNEIYILLKDLVHTYIVGTYLPVEVPK